MEKNSDKTIVIPVAILADEPLGWGSGKHYFPAILNNYTWKKNEITYAFKTDYVRDCDILAGNIRPQKYKVLLAPGGGVGDGHAVMKSFSFSRKVRRWKKQINTFIEQGGGYVGICGGTALFTGLSTGKHPRFQSFLERAYHKSSFNISKVNSFYRHLAFPLLYPFQYTRPDHVGATAYVFSFAPATTNSNLRIHSGGVPLDFKIDNSHPIFSDFKSKSLRMRWWGGPALDIKNNSNGLVEPVAWYPEKDFSLEKSTMIRAWRYTGGIMGLLNGFLKAAFFLKRQKQSLHDLIMYAYFFAGDWEKSDRIIDLDFANKPAITTETFPHGQQGRIVLCTAHPEYMVWWDGHIEEVEDNGFNCLASGLHQWKNITLSKENMHHDLTYTWWLVRRMVAWAAKIHDDHFPPIEKQEKNSEVKRILNKNIFWDGSINDQIQNI